MATNNRKPSLKETDPYRYYRKIYFWLVFFKWMFIILPIGVILGLYVWLALNGSPNTNPLDPIRFPLGLGIAVLVSAFAMLHEAKKENREKKEDEYGFDFSATLAWGLITLILWLCYISIYYLVLLCAAEFIGQFIAAFINFHIRKIRRIMNQIQNADINAKALRRNGVMTAVNNTKKGNWEPTE